MTDDQRDTVASIEALVKQRDAARDEAESLRAQLGAVELLWARVREQRDRAEAQYEDQRKGCNLLGLELSRCAGELHASKARLAGLLEALPRCQEPGCTRRATHAVLPDYVPEYRCTEHAGSPDDWAGWGELPWRPFLPPEAPRG